MPATARPVAQDFKRPESVLVVVHTLGGEGGGEVLLLCRRHPADFWQSVTGSLEWDEAPQACAVRELGEETGIYDVPVQDLGIVNSFPIHPAWRHRYHPAHASNVEHVFAVRLAARVDPRIDPDEHCAWCWLPWREGRSRATSWSDRDAIARLFL